MSQRLTAARLVRVAQAALVLAALVAWPAPAFASTTIGADLSGTPDTSSACGGMTGLCDVATLSESGVVEVSPIDGVVVRWRVKDSSGPLALRVVRPTAGYLFVSTSAIAIPSDTTGVDTFNTRQPIRAGDIVAVVLESPTATIGLDGTGNAPTGTRVTVWPGPVPDGLALPPPELVDQTRAYVNADIEPDADHDGFGDETQDQCPTDANTQGPCPPPPPPGPPPLPAPPPPPAKPTSKPSVSASIAKTIRLSKTGTISFLMTTNEAIDATATGTISLPTSAKLVRFKSTNVKLAAGKLTKVTLKLSQRNIKLIRMALRHHKLKTLITINVSDAAGNQTIKTRTAELTG